MECSNCKFQNSENHKYCSNCGKRLESNPQFSDAELWNKIELFLEKRYKDQHLVEIVTSENIVSRISSWMKLFGYFIGIPITLFLFLLGFLGYNTYSNISKNLKTAEIKIDKLNTAADIMAKNIAGKTKLLSQADSLYNQMKTYNEEAVFNKESGLISAKIITTTISGNSPYKIEGQIIGKKPNGFRVYGILMIGDQYSVMQDSIVIQANGNWSHPYTIANLGDRMYVGVILCDEKASKFLELQFSKGNWALTSLINGMKLLGTGQVYRK